jgi:hypothetical protein
MPYLVRLQRGFAIVAIMAVVLWVLKRNEATQQQRVFLITAFCGGLAGIVIAGPIMAMRKR